MCPACISSMTLAVAGATSTGAVGAFVVRSVARITRRGKTEQSESEEAIRHDYHTNREPNHETKNRLAS
jgi:hypothetical protein